jgi:hypothetical protein
MSGDHNPVFETLSAHVDHPPIDSSANPVKKPKKRKAAFGKKKKPTVPKPRKPQFGDVDTLSEESVLKRVNHISVCEGCGGHRICDRCMDKYNVVLPQTYRHMDGPGVDVEAEDYDPTEKFRVEPKAVSEEYCCKRNFDDDRDPNTCCAYGVGPLPCTTCLQFDDNGPTEKTWSYGEDCGFILNEVGVCPGCMINDPEEICTGCHKDNRGWN